MKIKTAQTLLLGLALVAWCGRANAQDYQWAQQMFEKLDHDFGVVARGADARYRLKITNKYKQPVHIASVTTTCGCTASRGHAMPGRGKRRRWFGEEPVKDGGRQRVAPDP